MNANFQKCGGHSPVAQNEIIVDFSVAKAVWQYPVDFDEYLRVLVRRPLHGVGAVILEREETFSEACGRNTAVRMA